jgi:RNA polymerase sigma-70 factor (ECF subfamily)
MAWTEEQVTSLVQEHQGAVLAYLRSLGCPADLVEDLLQDTFMRVLVGGLEDRGASATRAFLRRVARNLWIERLRREGRSRLLELEAVERAWQRFEREDEGDSYLAALRDCLGLLDPSTVEVLRLRYGDGLKRSEIARRRSASPSAIKSTLHRAKAHLRRCIERKVES